MTTECAPGVLRRKWTLELMRQRMLERWEAAVAMHNGSLIPCPVPSLRAQVEAEFGGRRYG